MIRFDEDALTMLQLELDTKYNNGYKPERSDEAIRDRKELLQDAAWHLQNVHQHIVLIPPFQVSFINNDYVCI